MAGSVTFILRKPKAKTETPVNMVFWYDQIRILLSTGEKIRPTEWNPVDHRARKTHKDYRNVNTRLDKIKGNVMNTVRDHLNKNGKVIAEILRKELAEVVKPKPDTDKKPTPVTFIQSINEYIKNCNKTPRTKLSYGTTKNILEKYEGYINKELTFDSINLDFYDDFIKFLTTVQRIENETIITGYAKNTIGDHIKKVKVFMNYALDKGYTENRGHLHRKFRTFEETPETIYLTEKELTDLYTLDLSENKKLDRVRDLFIIGCYTGLRFSDLSQLTPDKFIKNGTQLKIKTVKTGETVIIPLHWTIKEILKKYDGGTPRPISNQKMNEYLKELGEKAKFNEKIVLNRTQGGLSYDRTKEKRDLITVHTARRSFATNMFLAEVPTISIMKITGHRTERSFMKYIKISQEQNADKLSKHPYFTKSPLKVVNQ